MFEECNWTVHHLSVVVIFDLIACYYFRYNEGLLDITASSVEMIGEPKEVFKDLTNGNTVTKWVPKSSDLIKLMLAICWIKTVLNPH